MRATDVIIAGNVGIACVYGDMLWNKLVHLWSRLKSIQYAAFKPSLKASKSRLLRMLFLKLVSRSTFASGTVNLILGVLVIDFNWHYVVISVAPYLIWWKKVSHELTHTWTSNLNWHHHDLVLYTLIWSTNDIFFSIFRI